MNYVIKTVCRSGKKNYQWVVFLTAPSVIFYGVRAMLIAIFPRGFWELTGDLLVRDCVFFTLNRTGLISLSIVLSQEGEKSVFAPIVLKKLAAAKKLWSPG